MTNITLDQVGKKTKVADWSRLADREPAGVAFSGPTT